MARLWAQSNRAAAGEVVARMLTRRTVLCRPGALHNTGSRAVSRARKRFWERDFPRRAADRRLVLRCGNSQLFAAASSEDRSPIRVRLTTVFMAPDRTPASAWECPWCALLADRPADLRVICQSRICVCGALALGAPPEDTDEIIDDAINVFGIADGYLTELDSDRVAGLKALGVEVAEGRRIAPSAEHHAEIRVLWFRKDAAAT